MTTGHISIIKDGITFQQFAMNCARAFGACEVSEKHSKELDKACKKLDRINNLSLNEAGKEAIAEFTKENHRRELDIEKDRKEINQHKDMLRKVKQWQPPTPDHIEFKKFMVSQLKSKIPYSALYPTSSIEDYIYPESPIKKLPGEEWLAKEKKKALQDIDYHTTEKKRINTKNKWIADLRNSLERIEREI